MVTIMIIMMMMMIIVMMMMTMDHCLLMSFFIFRVFPLRASLFLRLWRVEYKLSVLDSCPLELLDPDR